jgi:hypothetical protein
MLKFLTGGKRGLDSSGTSPAEPPRKVLVQGAVQAIHPSEDTKYVCRQVSQNAKRDTPFTVIRWGDLGKDAVFTSADGKTDIIPHGLLVERRLEFVRSSSLFSFSEVRMELQATEESPVTVKLKRGPAKGSPCEAIVYCKTLFDDRSASMQYAVKEGRAAQFEDAFWKPTPTAACNAFLLRSGFEHNKNFVGPRMFGFQCDAVQDHLTAMRAHSNETTPLAALKTRGAMERDPLKAVVGRLAASVKDSLSASASSSASSSSAQASCGDESKVSHFHMFVE